VYLPDILFIAKTDLIRGNDMKTVIIGSGAVGGYFGAKLALGGNDVTFIARGEQLDAIRRSGLRITGISGDFKVFPAKATDRIGEAGTADLVILGVKAWQVKEAAKNLGPVMDKETIILPLQNGVLAAEELCEVIDSRNVIGGLCRIMSKIEAPGVIRHFGIDPFIVFGELNNEKTDRVLKLKEIFDKAEIGSKISDNILADLWKKFIGICAGGLLAVTRSTYGEVMELNETRLMMHELLTEIYDLSRKAGIDIHPDYVERTMKVIDGFPYDSTSSMTRDIWEGKPSEIEYQNGAVVRLGEKYGINTPVNRFIYNCVLPLELKARR
jgi:2-dehydropantoate 2-reductase